jgi:hypothetical protein
VINNTTAKHPSTRSISFPFFKSRSEFTPKSHNNSYNTDHLCLLLKQISIKEKYTQISADI